MAQAIGAARRFRDSKPTGSEVKLLPISPELASTPQVGDSGFLTCVCLDPGLPISYSLSMWGMTLLPAWPKSSS
ncbi:MAG: hypothetical protein AB7O55_31810, partial [Lautropia sp.]